MAFGPQLFMNQGGGGGMTTLGNPALMSPPQLEGLQQPPGMAEDLQRLVEDNRQPFSGIQLSEDMLGQQASFISRSGQQVMPNKNPEGFIREGGLIVDGDSVYIDSFEQSQVPQANLRGALIRLVQSGVPGVRIKSFTKSKVFGSRELIGKRFRV